jgi:hypothetical protein
MAELRDHFGLMRQHASAAQRYSEAAGRLIGPPTLHRLRRRTVLDSAAVRSAILMGPNARHIAASAFDAELGPLAVTFDIIVLFACKKWENPTLSIPAGGAR